MKKWEIFPQVFVPQHQFAQLYLAISFILLILLFLTNLFVLRQDQLYKIRLNYNFFLKKSSLSNQVLPIIRSFQMSSTKTLQSSFLSFFQSYKNLFNSTYQTAQQSSQLPQSLEQKRAMVQNLYQSYRTVINSIDSLQEINTDQLDKHHSHQNTSRQDEFVNNSLGAVGNHSSAHNIGGLNSVETRFERWEKDVCEQHDKAVHRYKKAIGTADVWRQKLYTYINENLPSGNN